MPRHTCPVRLVTQQQYCSSIPSTRYILLRAVPGTTLLLLYCHNDEKDKKQPSSFILEKKTDCQTIKHDFFVCSTYLAKNHVH